MKKWISWVIQADPNDVIYAAYSHGPMAPCLISFGSPHQYNWLKNIYFILHFKYVDTLRFLLDSKFESWSQVIIYLAHFSKYFAYHPDKKAISIVYTGEYMLKCIFLPTANLENDQSTGHLYLLLSISICRCHTS